jgi:hypothetical protein
MLNGPIEYRPVMLPRRGEFIAWTLALLVGAAWLFLEVTGRVVFLAMPILLLFLLFSAASISLGNWMDRRSVLRLDRTGLSFQNGLRNVHLRWEEIQEVRAWPAQWGKKVEVIGAKTNGVKAHFSFRTLGEVRVQGELKGRMGFEKGEEMLREIIQNSGLETVEHPGEGYFYTRR